LSYDDAIKALSKDALKLVKNNQIVGLGSGRAATALVKSLSTYVSKKKLTSNAFQHQHKLKWLLRKENYTS